MKYLGAKTMYLQLVEIISFHKCEYKNAIDKLNLMNFVFPEWHLKI